MPTISGDVATLLGEDHTAGDPVALWLLASQPILTDAGTGRTGGKIRIPVASNGTFTVADVPATSGGFPTYQLQIDSKSLRRAGQNRGMTTGSFPLTTDRDLTWIVDNYVPVTVVTTQVYADVQAAAALGATNDTATASYVANPASATKAALAASFAPKVVLSRQFQKPLYIAHRGGHLIHGEHSLEAYTACAQAGFAIEPDVQILSDGGLACIHDATTTRTMIQTAGTAQTTVASITSDAFVRDYRILPELAGSPYERPILLPEVLDLFGGRVLIVPEMKDTATREAIVAEVKARGLEKAVLCQSFNFADVEYSASQGIPSMYLSDTVGGVGATFAMVLGAGIGYIGASTAASQAYVDSLVAQGLKVVRWTMNQRNTADVYLGTSGKAIGIFTDDPWWASGKFAQRYTDPYREAVPWPHMLAGGGPAFCDGGYGKVDGTGAYTVAAQDWCPPIASGKARIDFEIVFKPFSTAQDRWVGIAFGLIPSENAYVDAATAGQEVVHCLIRRAGNLQVYRNGNTWVSGGPGVGQVAAAVQGAANAAAGMEAAVPFRFERTATEVRLTNRRTGEFVTWADTTAIYAGARFAFDNNGTDFVVRNVSVTPL